MADIFLSYDRDDEKVVRRIAEGLAASNLPHWWDKDLEDGANFSFVIEEKIESCRHVLVAWSANARRSLFVRGEALEALDRGKLIQVLIDKSRLPVPFNALQATFLNGWDGDYNDARWQKLVATLAGSVPSSFDVADTGAARPEPAAIPVQDLSRQDLLRAGVSPVQSAALWLLPTLLVVLIATGLVLLFVDLPEGVPKAAVLLGLCGGIAAVFCAFIALLMRSFLSTLDPLTRQKGRHNG